MDPLFFEYGFKVTLQFDYMHNHPVIKTSCNSCDVVELGGFHRDPNGVFRKQKILDIRISKEVVKGGDIWRKIEWKYGNAVDYKPSSCFPDNWSDEKTFSKVRESIRNSLSIKKSDKFNNRYVIRGRISESVIIESAVDIQNGVGKLVSYYPDLEGF